MRARVALLGAPVVALALAACGTDREPAPAAAPTAGATITVTDSDLGPILADQSGRTLYAFTKDKDRAGSCDAECVAVWPALSTTAIAGQGTNPALIGHAEPASGQTQASYGQWPLYYYVGDTTAGDLNGHGIDGEWFAISPDGTLIRKE